MNTSGFFSLAIGLSAICTVVFAQPVEFEQVNELRTQAGLPTLLPDTQLTVAAAGHAAYLDRHRDPGDASSGVSAHGQVRGMPGFVGESPVERVLAAGYPHRRVLENVSMGFDSGRDAIDGLMTAIYHRLTFLDPFADRLGVAIGKQSRVFVLGRSDIQSLCEAPPDQAVFRTPVDCLGRTMRQGYYEALCADLPDQAIYRPPHPVSCPNGRRLNAAFMDRLCRKPPLQARAARIGRHFKPCDNDLRIDADWFLGLCDGRVQGALYRASGRYFEICRPPRRVSAEWFEAQCETLPKEALYTDSLRFRRPCARPIDVRSEYIEALDKERLARLPLAVLWPPDGARDVPPAFFIEEPDPLPDRDVAGNPISIQFNPARARRAQMRGFKLYRLTGDDAVEVSHTRLLDSDNDPNKVLRPYQFALFPLSRLDWGTRYRAVIDAHIDGEPHRFETNFTTRGDDIPVLRASQARQQFVVDNGTDYLLFLPPQASAPHTVLSVRTEHLRGNHIVVEQVDVNTLRIRIEARFCDRIRMRFDAGPIVTLIPSGCTG